MFYTIFLNKLSTKKKARSFIAYELPLALVDYKDYGEGFSRRIAKQIHHFQ